MFIGILVFINLLHFVLEVGQLCSLQEMAYNEGHALHIDKWHFRRFSRVNVTERQRDAGERDNRSSAK